MSQCVILGVFGSILLLLFYFWWKILLANNVANADIMWPLIGVCTVCLWPFYEFPGKNWIMPCEQCTYAKAHLSHYCPYCTNHHLRIVKWKSWTRLTILHYQFRLQLCQGWMYHLSFLLLNQNTFMVYGKQLYYSLFHFFFVTFSMGSTAKDWIRSFRWKFFLLRVDPFEWTAFLQSSQC